MPAPRYSAVAIALHWAMALGILILVAMGLAMTHLELPPLRLFQLYQLHKSIGVTVLLLALIRVLWRLSHPPPPLPVNLSRAERTAASGVHGLLYVLMFAMPLTGWALVSASPLGIPTVLYGVMPWPHLPWFADLADKAAAEKELAGLHTIGGWAVIAAAGLHAAAAMRHHFILRDDVLWRMLPAWRRTRKAHPEKLS
jgi:cytochrome b561